MRFRYLLALACMAVSLLLPAFAYAGSFIDGISSSAILNEAVALIPYFGPVVLVVVGISFAAWGVTWIIGKLKPAPRPYERGYVDYTRQLNAKTRAAERKAYNFDRDFRLKR